MPMSVAAGIPVLDVDLYASAALRDSRELFARVRQAFLDLAAADPEHYLVLDARSPVEEIAAAVAARTEPLLAQATRERP